MKMPPPVRVGQGRQPRWPSVGGPSGSTGTPGFTRCWSGRLVPGRR